MLSVRGSVVAECDPTVSVLIEGGAMVSGGKQTRFEQASTAAEWCDLYGVKPTNGVVTLYKAVSDSYESSKGFYYKPGSTPTAPDWDGGKQECGCGLHFVPRPAMGLRYNNSATKFIACPVRLEDIVVHLDAEYPDKVKAARTCGECWEVDLDGEKVEPKVIT